MKKIKRTLTPKLRFPEFRDEPGWKEVPLEQIAERTTTKNLDGSFTRVLTNSAEHGIVDQRDYFDKDIANAGNIDRYYIVDLGDYVYNPRISTLAPVGPISRNNIGKGVMSPLYTVFRFTYENTDFYQHYFKTVSWHLYLRRVSSMGARHDRMSITAGDFMAMPVPSPLPQEQQKIADCLSSLDGLIAEEGRKLAALRDHKRGLMQQLFPQPGQTQPRLRFPEFRKGREWKERLLKSVVKSVKTGKLDANAMVEDGQYRFYTCAKNYYWIDNYAFDGEALLIAGNGAHLGYIHHYIGKFNAYQRTYVLQGFDVNVSFLKCFLDCNLPSRILLEKKDGNTPYIVLSTISDMTLLIPKDEEEQQRIADCLTSLDDLITSQTQKREVLKAHKKGLMQQLFAALEEQ